MKDRDFLIWIYDRLVEVHHEEEHFDYMLKLRDIIRTTDPGNESESLWQSKNSLKDQQSKDLEMKRAVEFFDGNIVNVKEEIND